MAFSKNNLKAVFDDLEQILHDPDLSDVEIFWKGTTSPHSKKQLDRTVNSHEDDLVVEDLFEMDSKESMEYSDGSLDNYVPKIEEWKPWRLRNSLNLNLRQMLYNHLHLN